MIAPSSRGNFRSRAYPTSAKKRLGLHSRRGPGPAQRAEDSAPSRRQAPPGSRRNSSAPRGSKQRAARWVHAPSSLAHKAPQSDYFCRLNPTEEPSVGSPRSGQVRHTRTRASLPSGDPKADPLKDRKRRGTVGPARRDSGEEAGPPRRRRAPESLRHPPPLQPSARCHQPRNRDKVQRAPARSGGRVPATARESEVRPEGKLVSQIRPAARDGPARAKARARESAVAPCEGPDSRETRPAAGCGGCSRGLQLDRPPGGDWGGGTGRGREGRGRRPGNGAPAQRRRG